MKEWIAASGLVIGALILSGCKASAPSGLESKIATDIKKTITVGDKDLKNPFPATADNIKEGAAHFQHHCQICHGLDGHATGVPFATSMSPPVPDLGVPDVQGFTDGQLHWIIRNGIGPSGMPAWKDILEDEEMWKIVSYLRNLPAKGSLGIPTVFKEESEQHQEAEHAHQHQHQHPEKKPEK